MGPLGWQETIVIFVLALLLFGPKKLPELGKTVAKAIGEFRRASNELKDTWNREMASIERENEEIRKEANEVATAASNYVSDATNYDYGYDSSYDYGAYGYSDSSTAETTPTAEVTSSVGASETSGADNAATAGEVEIAGNPQTPEGVVPTSSGADPQTATR